MKLIICGNGFDKNHGFQTGYESYRKFLIEKYPHSLRKFEEFQYIGLTKTDKWSDLEEALTIDYEQCAEDSLSTFYPDIINNDSDSRWYDFQVDVESQTKFIYDFTGRYFFEWLNGVDYSLAKRKCKLNCDDLYVTFNYTSTLEEVYNIPKDNIYHIHGYLGSIREMNIEDKTIDGFVRDESNNSIIRECIQFGSIYNNGEITKNYLEQRYGEDDFYSVSIEPGITDLVEFCEVSTKDIKRNYKKLENYIKKQNIDQVVIMGHSIRGIDKSYYIDVIVPILGECFWTFYYHSEKDLKDIECFIQELNIKEYECISW